MDNKDYRFGIIISKRFKTGENSYTIRNMGACSCGQHIFQTTINGMKFECNKCANDYFIDARNQRNERFVIPYLGVLRKDNRGFRIKRINLSIKYNDDGLQVIKENLTRTMDFDIIDKTLRVWREDEIEFELNGEKAGNMDFANKMFFTQLDLDTFLEVASNEVTRGLYQIAKRMSSGGWGRTKKNILKGLSKMMNCQWMQVLANAGVPQVDRFYSGGGYYERYSIINEKETKPHKILGIPKFMMQYIREDMTIDRNVLRELRNHLKNIDNNKFREIMAIVKDESNMKGLSSSIETIMQIHIDYEYTNLKKLVLYLFREVRLMQGISQPQDASTYLRDYIRMSRSMGLDWEKYPKSLKKEHDVVQMNYNLINASADKQRQFSLAVSKKSYQNLVYQEKKSKYEIIVPETTEEIIKEGNQLSHCVASYVSDVINDKCKIIFLRESEELDKPLATIEVRGFNIRQARGFANRAINEEQREFIKNWAEEKNLVEAYY